MALDVADLKRRADYAGARRRPVFVTPAEWEELVDLAPNPIPPGVTPLLFGVPVSVITPLNVTG